MKKKDTNINAGHSQLGKDSTRIWDMEVLIRSAWAVNKDFSEKGILEPGKYESEGWKSGFYMKKNL